MNPKRNDALIDVVGELASQDQKWGKQSHKDGTGPRNTIAGKPVTVLARLTKSLNDENENLGEQRWSSILMEEFLEAVETEDPDKLYDELAQVAAVAIQWMADIKSREDDS